MILQELQEKGEVNNYESGFRTKSGEIIATHFSARPIHFNDELCVISVINDISELKKKEKLIAEERNMLRSLIDNIPDLVYKKDSESRFVIANKTLADVLGKTVEDLLGRTDLELFPENLSQVFFNDERKLLQTGHPVLNKEETIYDTKGNAILLQTTKLPLRNSNGLIIGLVGSGHIITEFKKAEEKIRQLNMELEKRVVERTEKLHQAYKELESFSYSLSHDLRAPLRHAEGYIRMMLENITSPGETVTGYADKMVASLKRMGTLIDAMLSFTSIGRKELVMINVDMNVLIFEIVEQFHEETVSRNIIWKVHHLPHLWGDQSLLRIAFENLLSNAIKYTTGRSTPIIEVWAHELPGNQKEFFIRDNGVGFYMAYVGKLFGVFQRLHSQDQFAGTGIGLANAKQIIIKHSGTIQAEGKVNEGATFTITMPG